MPPLITPLDAAGDPDEAGLRRFVDHAVGGGVTGLVLTKLDGTAKGGVAVTAAERLGVPIQFVGMGEELEDLAPFDPDAYVEWLLSD